MEDDEAAFLNEGISSFRTQHSMTRQELINSIANKIMYSTHYKLLYLVMALLSLISVILSLKEQCPSGWFKFLEVVITAAMVAEVSLRIIAVRKLYWQSYSNIADLVVVTLSFIVLVVVLSNHCSQGTTIIDSILLVTRNVVQFVRLFLMLRKNNRNLNARETTIDFADVRAPSIDFTDDDMGYALDDPRPQTQNVRRGLSPGRIGSAAGRQSQSSGYAATPDENV